MAEDRAIAWADALLESEPLFERLPEQFRQKVRARARQIEAEVAAERHPVSDAIAAMRTGAPHIGGDRY